MRRGGQIKDKLRQQGGLEMQSPLYQMNELSLDLMHAVAFKHHRFVRLPVHAERSQKCFRYGEKQAQLVKSRREKKKNLNSPQVEASPLVQVRPSSRSKPSGHSQLKEPRVFTHLEPSGQGLSRHSSTSASWMKNC